LENLNSHSFIKYANETNKICEKLFSQTPVNYFATVRTFKDSKYAGCVSDIKWAKHYLIKKYDQCSIEPYQAFNNEEDYILWSISSIFNVDKTAGQLYQDASQFGYSNGITLIERYENWADLYYFASDNRKGIDEFFITNIDQLKCFILFFKEIVHTHKYFKNLYSTQYQVDGRIVESTNFDYDSTSLWNTLNIKRFYIGSGNVYLTKKEMSVLYFHTQGKTQKEISKELNISHRTVETHIINAREKLGCHRRSDILKLLSQHSVFPNLELDKL